MWLGDPRTCTTSSCSIRLNSLRHLTLSPTPFRSRCKPNFSSSRSLFVIPRLRIWSLIPLARYELMHSNGYHFVTAFVSKYCTDLEGIRTKSFYLPSIFLGVANLTLLLVLDFFIFAIIQNIQNSYRFLFELDRNNTVLF